MTIIIYIDLQRQTYHLIESDDYPTALACYLRISTRVKLIVIFDTMTKEMVYKCPDYAHHYRELNKRYFGVGSESDIPVQIRQCLDKQTYSQ